MYKYVWIIIFAVIALCGLAELAHSGYNSDIVSYMDIAWGTEYDDMSAHLEEMGDGKLYPIKCSSFPCSAFFVNGQGFGGLDFKRLALFDADQKLIAVKMMAEATPMRTAGVFESIVDWIEKSYGMPDVQMITGTVTGTKQTMAWRRKSGNVTFTYVQAGEHNGYSILFTATKGGSHE